MIISLGTLSVILSVASTLVKLSVGDGKSLVDMVAVAVANALDGIWHWHVTKPPTPGSPVVGVLVGRTLLSVTVSVKPPSPDKEVPVAKSELASELVVKMELIMDLR